MRLREAFRESLLFIIPLLLASVVVAVSMYSSNPDDLGRALEAGFAALTLGAGVVVAVLLFLPWPARWGAKPGPVAGLSMALGALGLGALGAASVAGVRIPSETALDGLAMALFIGGGYLYSREAQLRKEDG